MSHDIKLGQIISGSAHRDAIHVAVMPATATETLSPGQHIGLAESGYVSAKATSKIGIVDPFLTHSVTAGQRVYIFLYPNSITSLRHSWSHPEIDEEDLKEKEKDSAQDKLLKSKHDSKVFLSNYADQMEISYDELMRGFENGYITIDQGHPQCYADVSSLAMQHYINLTGKTSLHRRPTFSCAC